VKGTILCVLWVSCVLAGAQQSQTQASGTALTIYNQDLAVVRTSVDLDLKPGSNEVTTTKVTSQLEPDSVVLRDPKEQHPVQIVEQNYDAAIASQMWMLQKYEGQSIDFEVQRYDKADVIVQGKILRAPMDGSEPLIEVDGKMQFQLPGLPLFPASTDGLLLKPTLRWEIFSKDAAQFPAELSYLTHGFNWNATYNIVAAGESATGSGTESMDVIGWVTMSNDSGTDFTNARVKLMAGDVAVARPAALPRARQMMLASQMVAGNGAMAVTQKSFDDFHLYDLNRQVTLKDRETKQIEFIRAEAVPVTRKYVYDGAQDLPETGAYNGAVMGTNFGLSNTKHVRVEQEFANSKQNHLGMPLPAGTIRFYRRDSDGQMEFVGENTIDHTPEDGKVRLQTGTAFDVTGERTRTDFRVNAQERTIDESYSIMVKNAKDKPVDVSVVEHLFRAANWDIVGKSTDFVKRDSSTVEFPVTVPAHGEKVVTYTVHYSWED
jgi:hypothetical protein